MGRNETPPGDDFKIRCPRLGHQIHFGYCRVESGDLPCTRTLDCWHAHFQVEEYLKQSLSAEEWDKVFCKSAKPKMLSLLELIEQSKKMTKDKEP